MSIFKILHQGNGVFNCKSRGSHKWTRGGRKLGLKNNAFILCIAEIRVHSRNSSLVRGTVLVVIFVFFINGFCFVFCLVFFSQYWTFASPETNFWYLVVHCCYCQVLLSVNLQFVYKYVILYHFSIIMIFLDVFSVFVLCCIVVPISWLIE